MKTLRISEHITVEDYGADILGHMVAVRCDACGRVCAEILAGCDVRLRGDAAIRRGLLDAMHELVKKGCTHGEVTLRVPTEEEKSPCATDN